MEITGLEITLGRISQIQSNFDKLINQEITKGPDFKSVLDDKLNPNAELPSSIFVQPFSQASSTPKTEFDSIIKKCAQENNIDENLVKAVIKAESGFNPNAQSPVGAQGLMQLMPNTAKGLGVDNPLNPEQNIEGGTKYLRGLLDRYDGRMDMALAAYNAGSGAVSKYNGIPPYKETQNYVKRVMEYQRQMTGN